MQKDRGWTEGSKTGKLMGLNAKNRADLELLLNWRGLRVNSRKVQGLFSKIARPKGYILILVAYAGSDGQERLGVRAAAEGRRRRVPAAGTRRSRLNSAVRGSIQLGLGSGSFSVAWVNHLGPWFGVRVS